MTKDEEREREQIWLGRLNDADARATRISADLAEALAEICKIKGNLTDLDINIEDIVIVEPEE
jgi:hypothetical protein